MAICDRVGGCEFRAETIAGERVHTIDGQRWPRDAWVRAWHKARERDAAALLVIDGVRYDGMPAPDKWLALVDTPWRLTLRCPHNLHVLLDPSGFDAAPAALVEHLRDRYRRGCSGCRRSAPPPALDVLIERARRYPEVAVYRSPAELVEGVTS